MTGEEQYRKVLSEYEQFLNTLTEEARRTIAEHAVSFCKLDGEYLPMPHEKENLFEVVSQRERYVVDTNSNWQAESARPENRDKAFILGQTIIDEQDNMRGLLFGPKVKLHNRNIFVLSVFHASDPSIGNVMMLERLDAHYASVFDETSLREGSKPRKERKDAKSLEYQRQFKAGVEHERQVILLLLGKIKEISELPVPKELKPMRARFLAFIRKESPECSGDYLRAVGVARYCYALLLAEVRKMRTEFSKRDYLNVFGDTRIIQNALFLQAEILSGDRPLKRMASYAGLNCVNKIS